MTDDVMDQIRRLKEAGASSFTLGYTENDDMSAWTATAAVNGEEYVATGEDPLIVVGKIIEVAIRVA